MSDLILHHYPLSPFAEKIRLMLGYAGLDWQSVITREMPPRPQLAILAGGYRKIPVAQIGADVFCDTRCIATEVARLARKPRLALEKCSPQEQGFASTTDFEVFFACLQLSGTRPLLRRFRQALSLADLARLVWDRFNLGRSADLAALSPRAARQRVQQHLATLEQLLAGQPFLYGRQPCHADFSAYHSLWFLLELAGWPLPGDYPRLLDWLARMRAFGHGQPTQIDAASAVAMARAASPRAIAPAHRRDARIGQEVAVAPSDYGQIATRGRLVGVTPASWIIARETAEAGTLHLHFPQTGFNLEGC